MQFSMDFVLLQHWQEFDSSKHSIIISKDQAIEQIEKAERVLGMIEPYLEEHWSK